MEEKQDTIVLCSDGVPQGVCLGYYIYTIHI